MTDPPRTHPHGVAIPPNPGDANYEPKRAAEQRIHPCHYEPCCGERGPLCRPDAPETPHAPRSAPGTLSSEALRAALPVANAVVVIRDALEEGMGHAAVLDGLDSLLPIVVAYGDQRAAKAITAVRNAVDSVATVPTDVARDNPDFTRGYEAAIWEARRITSRRAVPPEGVECWPLTADEIRGSHQ